MPVVLTLDEPHLLHRFELHSIANHSKERWMFAKIDMDYVLIVLCRRSHAKVPNMLAGYAKDVLNRDMA